MLNDVQGGKLLQFETITIRHPRMSAAFEQFDNLRFKSRQVKAMDDSDRLSLQALSAVTMIAATGSGKTTIINAYMKKVMSEKVERDMRPVVCVNLSAAVTVKGFYADVLSGFGDPNFARGTQQQLAQRMQFYLRECGVELLIIDEVHHLISAETNKVRWDVAELFKCILNDKSCCLVLSGVDKASFLFDRGGQLARRCVAPIELGPLRLEIESEREIFLGFLVLLDQEMAKLKITEGSNGFVAKGMPAAFYEVSGGVIGVVFHLIYQALSCCFERGGVRVEACDLAHATDVWAIPGGFAARNPFTGLMERP